MEVGKTVKCPYCMDVIKRSDLKYQCKKCGKFYKIKGKSLNCPQKGCGAILNVICPTCGKELPPSILQFDEYIKFCIVGQTECGKTNYITVMLEEFKEKLCDKMLISAMNSETYDTHAGHVENLYKKKIKLPPTISGYVTPQLWQITDRTKYNKMSNSYKVYSLNIFDGAGEDYENNSDVIKRYINGSDYIFFLLDPLQLSKVRIKLGQAEEEREASKSIVKEMAQYLKAMMGLQAGRKIDKPLAVILTKFDEIKKLFGDAQVTRENEEAYKGSFHKNDLDAVDSEIRGWLDNIGESYFLSELEVNFKTIRFFGVSSYGHAPVNGNVGVLMPHRVLDPVMWVLEEEGIIKGK